MLKRSFAAIPVAAMLLAAPVMAQNCSAPEMVVDLPDGKSATLEQMNAARAKVAGAKGAMDEYLKCLDMQMSSLKSANRLSGGERKDLVDRYNGGVNSLARLAAQFNDQLKAFKSR